jgi:putative methanogenesis marker protein 3
MTLGMTQKEAEDYLKSIGITHEKTGLVDDEAIVVEQIPEFSIDIMKESKVETKGINKEGLALVEIYDKEDEAPRSSWYFRKITGLVEKPIGALKVHFAFPGMKMSIFEGDSKEAKGLVPENTPGSCVEGGKIGLTNMSKKNVGLIGVRFESNDEFGPTAEPFKATNIVGKIWTDLKPIEKIKEGELLYIQEYEE